MTKLQFERLDHIHVYVESWDSAERWYRDVLGFQRVAELENWAVSNGPLMIEDSTGTIRLALFEQARQENRSTIAFRVTAAAFLKWRALLAEAFGKDLPPVDHGLAWSMYFNDPDGNPYEITTYEYDAIQKSLHEAW